jgi:hypothetical protein
MSIQKRGNVHVIETWGIPQKELDEEVIASQSAYRYGGKQPTENFELCRP